MAACLERLTRYLAANTVPFEVRHHREVFTAQAMAAELHEPGAQVAKVVMAWVHRQLVMLVLPAPEHVDFCRLGQLMHDDQARMAREHEFMHLFPDCEVGAMPPFGHLYQVPVYIDRRLTQSGTLAFQAGSHRTTIRLATADFLRVTSPTVVAFTLDPHPA